MKRCDLHCHSCFSDGSLTPTQLVRLAEQQGLSALALTDHNTAKGLPELMQAGKKSEVITVAGCELSTDYNGTELHIVALFMPEQSWQEIEDFVYLMHLAKHDSNLKLIASLNEAGYAITYEEAAALTDADEFNRAHVARVLCEKGYVSSVSEAFEKLLGEERGYYVSPKRISSLAAIRFIKANGGVAVLAHPFFSMNEEGLLTFLPQAKEAGLDAMETHYSTFDATTTQRAEQLAEQFGLKQSGGSDFHGKAKPDIALGSGRGDLVVPFAFYENLLKQ